MTGRTIIIVAALAALLASPAARAQDVPGIEICTVEKTMERRTSCLQSNVEFLHKTIDKMRLEQQQRLDQAKFQINALSSAVSALQKKLDDLQAAQAKATPAAAGKDAAPASKDALPASKDAKDAAKAPAPPAKDAK
ncbi:hypothetical protein [Rhodopseudomonas sp. B29]|uniref:hypothetical protein n=1 Tax=Rhodopseudomonas sp. B29 TaxID=95607 RepID=UPI00034DC5AB|nr:hypothetical protein [Rhodopseudomonas sp. B29]